MGSFIAGRRYPVDQWRNRRPVRCGFRPLRAEQRLGRVAARARVDAVAALVVGVCHDLVLSHLLDPAAPAPAELSPGAVDDLVTTLLHGIAPPGD
ncbi:hypothetical protein [Micromonospora deserti]|uniref:Tetracyclin repressor-like C-terminal domain-containing protein n=1 Tax=Micromonospora deserti TaxID=2070366 RepID=A0A2W2CCM9_9ACTN|nr:hypothetical protein [Micromonospora deserti]PZF90624.1 hypothetical protein C1I99_24285 [Micromonospora deserti]